MADETASDRLEAHVTGPKLDRDELLREARDGDEGLQRPATADFGRRKTSREIVDDALDRLRADLAEIFAPATSLTRPLEEGEEGRYTSDAAGQIYRDGKLYLQLALSTRPVDRKPEAAFVAAVLNTLRSTPPQAEETKLREALEQIASEQKVYKGHGDYDILPALTAEEAQSLARSALSNPSLLPLAAEGLTDWRCIHCKHVVSLAGTLAPERCPECRHPHFAECAKSAASPIPPDHVLVTKAMEAAGGQEMFNLIGADLSWCEKAVRVYKAMLTAAPQPPSPGQGEGQSMRVFSPASPASLRATDLSGAHTMYLGCFDSQGRHRTLCGDTEPRVAIVRAAPPPSGEAEAVARKQEYLEQLISAWAFAHNIDGAARNDLFKRIRQAFGQESRG